MKRILSVAPILLVASFIVTWQDEKKEEVPEPEKVKTLHEAMEGVGQQSKKVGFAFRDKKYARVEADSKKMVEYIAKAIGFDPPELVKTEENKKEYRDFQKKLKKKIQEVQEAAGKKDFKAAKKAWRSASPLCAKCHKKYRPEKEEDE